MPTVKENIASIRELLGNPPYEALNNSTIIIHLYDEICELLNRLNLTDSNWIISRFALSVNPSQDEYPLPPDCGRLIVVETMDDSDFNLIRREVEIIDFQDFNLYWNGVRDLGLSPFKHNAICCAEFGLDTQVQKTIKFAPPPNQAAQYRCWYEIGNQPLPALNEKPKLMEQFHPLLRVNTAMALCPHLMKSPLFNQNMYVTLRDQLAWKAKRYTDTFETYIQQSFHEDTGPRRAFNSSRQETGDDW